MSSPKKTNFLNTNIVNEQPLQLLQTPTHQIIENVVRFHPTFRTVDRLFTLLHKKRIIDEFGQLNPEFKLPPFPKPPKSLLNEIKELLDEKFNLNGKENSFSFETSIRDVLKYFIWKFKKYLKKKADRIELIGGKARALLMKYPDYLSECLNLLGVDDPSLIHPFLNSPSDTDIRIHVPDAEKGDLHHFQSIIIEYVAVNIFTRLPEGYIDFVRKNAFTKYADKSEANLQMAICSFGDRKDHEIDLICESILPRYHLFSHDDLKFDFLTRHFSSDQSPWQALISLLTRTISTDKKKTINMKGWITYCREIVRGFRCPDPDFELQLFDVIIKNTNGLNGIIGEILTQYKHCIKNHTIDNDTLLITLCQSLCHSHYSKIIPKILSSLPKSEDPILKSLRSGISYETIASVIQLCGFLQLCCKKSNETYPTYHIIQHRGSPAIQIVRSEKPGHHLIFPFHLSRSLQELSRFFENPTEEKSSAILELFNHFTPNWYITTVSSSKIRDLQKELSINPRDLMDFGRTCPIMPLKALIFLATPTKKETAHLKQLSQYFPDIIIECSDKSQRIELLKTLFHRLRHSDYSHSVSSLKNSLSDKELSPETFRKEWTLALAKTLDPNLVLSAFEIWRSHTNDFTPSESKALYHSLFKTHPTLCLKILPHLKLKPNELIKELISLRPIYESNNQALCEDLSSISAHVCEAIRSKPDFFASLQNREFHDWIFNTQILFKQYKSAADLFILAIRSGFFSLKQFNNPNTKNHLSPEQIKEIFKTAHANNDINSLKELVSTYDHLPLEEHVQYVLDTAKLIIKSNPENAISLLIDHKSFIAKSSQSKTQKDLIEISAQLFKKKKFDLAFILFKTFSGQISASLFATKIQNILCKSKPDQLHYFYQKITTLELLDSKVRHKLWMTLLQQLIKYKREEAIKVLLESQLIDYRFGKTQCNAITDLIFKVCSSEASTNFQFEKIIQLIKLYKERLYSTNKTQFEKILKHFIHTLVFDHKQLKTAFVLTQEFGDILNMTDLAPSFVALTKKGNKKCLESLHNQMQLFDDCKDQVVVPLYHALILGLHRVKSTQLLSLFDSGDKFLNIFFCPEFVSTIPTYYFDFFNGCLDLAKSKNQFDKVLTSHQSVIDLCSVFDESSKFRNIEVKLILKLSGSTHSSHTDYAFSRIKALQNQTLPVPKELIKHIGRLFQRMDSDDTRVHAVIDSLDLTELTYIDPNVLIPILLKKSDADSIRNLVSIIIHHLGKKLSPSKCCHFLKTFFMQILAKNLRTGSTLCQKILANPKLIRELSTKDHTELVAYHLSMLFCFAKLRKSKEDLDYATDLLYVQLKIQKSHDYFLSCCQKEIFAGICHYFEQPDPQTKTLNNLIGRIFEAISIFVKKDIRFDKELFRTEESIVTIKNNRDSKNMINPSKEEKFFINFRLELCKSILQSNPTNKTNKSYIMQYVFEELKSLITQYSDLKSEIVEILDQFVFSTIPLDTPFFITFVQRARELVVLASQKSLFQRNKAFESDLYLYLDFSVMVPSPEFVPFGMSRILVVVQRIINSGSPIMLGRAVALVRTQQKEIIKFSPQLLKECYYLIINAAASYCNYKTTMGQSLLTSIEFAMFQQQIFNISLENFMNPMDVSNLFQNIQKNKMIGSDCKDIMKRDACEICCYLFSTKLNLLVRSGLDEKKISNIMHLLESGMRFHAFNFHYSYYYSMIKKLIPHVVAHLQKTYLEIPEKREYDFANRMVQLILLDTPPIILLDTPPRELSKFERNERAKCMTYWFKQLVNIENNLDMKQERSSELFATLIEEHSMYKEYPEHYEEVKQCIKTGVIVFKKNENQVSTVTSSKTITTKKSEKVDKKASKVKKKKRKKKRR